MYKNIIHYRKCLLLPFFVLPALAQLYSVSSTAQENAAPPAVKKVKPVKNTFESVWIIDNPTVMVPVKGTLEFDIQHRFGTVETGKKDFWGLFAPSNIRLGMQYAPINNLFVGAGVTKERFQVDINAKYAILKQTRNVYPVSLTYFGNVVIDARDKSNFRNSMHRLSYFNQLIVARKITEKLSVQVAPAFTWFNNVEAYVNSKGEIKNKMNNSHLSVSASGRYKISGKTAIIAGYDQPLTQHTTNNPHPNISFGIELTTSSHAFQLFAGNYYGITPQVNNFLNRNDYREGQFLIGFNITRLWNF
ncbi:MAG: hypothetical protein JNM68_03060 [Dinghuibacter sp.]|nr:hypothetical protein [Dinghuibacter sp.]